MSSPLAGDTDKKQTRALQDLADPRRQHLLGSTEEQHLSHETG